MNGKNSTEVQLMSIFITQGALFRCPYTFGYALQGDEQYKRENVAVLMVIIPMITVFLQNRCTFNHFCEVSTRAFIKHGC